MISNPQCPAGLGCEAERDLGENSHFPGIQAREGSRASGVPCVPGKCCREEFVPEAPHSTPLQHLPDMAAGGRKAGGK